MIKLHDYFRSTASYRVRIALNLKQVIYEKLPVHLVKGEQLDSNYLGTNPQGLVPTLIDNEHIITQSLAILEYLDEQYPTPKLLPDSAIAKAYSRAIAQIITSDIHPLNNLRVLKYLTGTLQHSEEEKQDWYHHWIIRGFTAIEELLSRYQTTPSYCIGTQVSFADICLIPQVYNANRFNCPLGEFPKIMAVNDHCLTLNAFEKAHPDPHQSR